MLNDLVYAARTLWRSRPLASAAIATIALGIGASTAIFTVAEAVLLRPLPYSGADRLVVATAELRQRNAVDLPFSGPDYFDLRSGARTMFEDFAAVQTGRTVVRHQDGTVEEVRFASVSPNFLTLLGGAVVMGRTFTNADGQPLEGKEPGPPGQSYLLRSTTVAVLSYEYWQRRYGGSDAVLGQGLAGTRAGAQIVGVLAPGFELLFPPKQNVERSPDVWVAARLSPDASQRAMLSHRIVGRLRDRVGLEAARAEANAVAAGLRRDFPLWQTAGFQIRLEPFHRYLIAQVKPALVALMVAAICLLLIACANVANLLLVRASLRERELALRSALGASSWRLVRQMLAEALVLAGAGTIFGMALAWGGLHALLAVAPANLPRLESIGLNPVAFAFAALLGLCAAAVFGVAPALRGSRTDLIGFLRMAGSTAGLERGRALRSGVVVAEIALSLMLLVGSGLMLRSFIALRAIDPGFAPPGLLTFQVLGFEQSTPERREATMRALHSAVSAIPGVERATAASPFPLADPMYPIRWGKEDALTDPSRFQAVDYQAVLPGYFETLETRLIAGRTFVEADNAPEHRVVVIDEVLAAKAFPGGSAVGQRIRIRIRTPEPEWVEVVGVVAHQRASSLAEVGREQIYFADGFLGHGAASRWAIRTTGDPTHYQAAVRTGVSKVGGQLVATEFQSMDMLVDRSQAGTRFSFLLIAVLASVAALLAGVGIYGVLSTNVRQRTAEIGIRLALGASPSSVFALIARQGLILSAAGIVIGLAAALGLAQTMTSMLVGVRARDPMTFVVVSALFLLVAATASVFAAHRAATVNPTRALRGE